MKTNLFLIRCLSNMRVGNGDVNYSLIDNEVERDPVLSGTPIINSSGVKGALREHFKEKWGESAFFKRIFGKDRQGEYKFLQATTLFRPLRVSVGNVSYVEATSPELLGYFNKTVKALNAEQEKLPLEKGLFTDKDDIQEIEGKSVEKHPGDKNIYNLLKKATGLETNSYYVTDNLNEYDLPVQARNYLDDGGQSKNLWYEEVVPHETIMWFAILTPEEINPEFKQILNEEIFQFGGSASVGYGLTRIIALEDEKNEQTEN